MSGNRKFLTRNGAALGLFSYFSVAASLEGVSQVYGDDLRAVHTGARRSANGGVVGPPHMKIVENSATEGGRRFPVWERRFHGGRKALTEIEGALRTRRTVTKDISTVGVVMDDHRRCVYSRG